MACDHIYSHDVTGFYLRSHTMHHHVSHITLWNCEKYRCDLSIREVQYACSCNRFMGRNATFSAPFSTVLQDIKITVLTQDIAITSHIPVFIKFSEWDTTETWHRLGPWGPCGVFFWHTDPSYQPIGVSISHSLKHFRHSGKRNTSVSRYGICRGSRLVEVAKAGMLPANVAKVKTSLLLARSVMFNPREITQIKHCAWYSLLPWISGDWNLEAQLWIITSMSVSDLLPSFKQVQRHMLSMLSL